MPSEIETSPSPRGLGDEELPCRMDPPAYASLRRFVRTRAYLHKDPTVRDPWWYDDPDPTEEPT